MVTHIEIVDKTAGLSKKEIGRAIDVKLKSLCYSAENGSNSYKKLNRAELLQVCIYFDVTDFKCNGKL